MAKKEKVYGTHLKVSTKRAGHKIGGTVGIFVFLLVLALFMALPIYLAVVMSLKPVQELFVFPPKLYVQRPTSQNFEDMLKVAGSLDVPFSRYVFNSVFVSVVVTVAQLFLSSSAAYVLSKVKAPGVKAMNKVIEIALLFTSSVTYIVQYIVMAGMGMIDTYWAITLPYIATPMGLFLMKQFMETGVSNEVLESARLDGAGEFYTFWVIAMPMVKPAWLTLMIESFKNLWNSGNSIYIYSEQLKTFNYAINQIVTGGIARAGVGAAATVVMMVVPITVFVICQSNVIETMGSSGMKD